MEPHVVKHLLPQHELASAARDELTRILVPERLALPASTTSQDPDDEPEIVDAEIVEDGSPVHPARPRRLRKKKRKCSWCGGKGRYLVKSIGAVLCAACRDEVREQRREQKAEQAREALIGAQHWDDEAGGWNRA